MRKNIISFKQNILNKGNNFFVLNNNTSKGLSVFLTNILIIFINTLTGVIVARYLGPQGRGEQAAIIMWPSFLAFCMTFGIPSAVLYKIKKDNANKSSYIGASLLLGICFGVLATMVGILLVPALLQNYSNEVIKFTKIIMFLSVFNVISTIGTSILLAIDRIQLRNKMLLLNPITTLILLLFLIVLNKINAYSVASAYLFGSVPVMIYILYHIFKSEHPKVIDLKSTCSSLFNYGFKAYGVDIMGTLSSNLDKIVIVGLLAPSSMGLYVIAVSIAKMINIFQTTIVTLLLPKASEKNKYEAANLSMLGFRICIIITIPIGLLIILICPFIIRVMYGESFVDASVILRILIINEIISMGIYILAQSFMATGNPGIVSLLQTIGFIAAIPLLIALTSTYGLIGAGTALLISTLVRFLFILYLFRREYKIKLNLFSLKNDILWIIGTVKLKKKSKDL